MLLRKVKKLRNSLCLNFRLALCYSASYVKDDVRCILNSYLYTM